MKLEFENLVIDQFKSFIGVPHELVLESFGAGLHFVRGNNLDEPRISPNGCGKSTIFEALCWCLYGRTPGGLRNPDIKAWFGKRGARVGLVFKKDGESHKIARTASPNKLLLDDREVGQSDVETFIGMNFDTFTNTVLYGQERPLFFDLEPAKKLGLFGAALNLDRWEVRSKAAGTTTEELEEQEHSLASEAEALMARGTQTARLLEQALGHWRGWRDEQTTLTENLQARLTVLQTHREEQETARGAFDLEYDSAMTEVAALQRSNRALMEKSEEVIMQRSRFHAQLATFRSRIQDYTVELEALGTADRCPVCNQSIRGTNLETHKTELQRKLSETEGKRGRIERTVANLTAKINQNQQDLAASRDDEDEFKRKANTARDRRDQLTPKIATAVAQITAIKEQLKTQERASNPYAVQVRDFRQTNKELTQQHSALVVKLTALRTHIERVKFWVRGFKEVKLLELEDVLQELEITTAATLESVGLVDWKVTYAVEKETKAETVQRGLFVFVQGPHNEEPVRWECWSGGERQRLRLVGAMALSEVLLSRAGVEPNLEVLDEPTQHLSPGGIEDLCDLLAERAKNLGRMVFYADHNTVQSSKFASVLTVVKDADGSRLELTDE